MFIKLLLSIFKFCCILVTIIMIVFWIYKYQLNKDVTSIEYILVSEIDDIVHPEFSIFILHPILNNELQRLLNVSNDDTLADQYLKFLTGNETYNEKFRAVDYEEVTPNIWDYLENLDITWKDENKGTPTVCMDIQNCPFVSLKNTYNGMVTPKHFAKAFGMELNPIHAKNVSIIQLTFNSHLESVLVQVQRAYAIFHHPNQSLRHHGGSQLIWNQLSNQSYLDIFEILSTELLKRRNKKNDPCLSDWRSYDDFILETHIQKIGCRAPYQKPFKNISICKTPREMKSASFEGNIIAEKEFRSPCQEMPSVVYKHIFHFEKITENENKIFKIYLQYPRKGKIVTQSRAIDGQSLIGNIGGYIGLFLG